MNLTKHKELKTMTNIYDKANEFERALRESAEYKASVAASEGLYADEEANALYTEFVSKQKELMEGAQAGNEPSEEELTVFEEIQQKLMGNAKFLEFVQAQQKLQFLIEDLNKVMYKPLDELFEKYGNK
jgi:UPF0342 protein SPD_1206